MSATLFQISQLAKTNPRAAEKALKPLLCQWFPELAIKSLKINSSAVSLNSINGFLQTPEKEYFFKFHTEEGEEQNLEGGEYYQAEKLYKAGLPMIRPMLDKKEPGRQCVIYPKIDAKTAFDLYHKEDINYLKNKRYNKKIINVLLKAEKELTIKQFKLFKKSLQLSSNNDIKSAPINQLFFNRLRCKNSTPKIDLFYTNKNVQLPKNKIKFSVLSRLKWVINNRHYDQTIMDIIDMSTRLLNPLNKAKIATVTGHGDGHSGNKFFMDGHLVFFDLAVAGTHPALLSFVKETIHNTFLHPLWLYNSEQLINQLSINYEIKNNTIFVTHNLEFNNRSPVRKELLNIYTKNLWKPLIKILKKKGWLQDDWEAYIRCAFFCCPFLVQNLIDHKKYSPVASLLALSKCIELGSKTNAKDNFTNQFMKKILD